MLEALQMPFMQRALLAGLLIGGLTGYYGVFIVQRRLSFLGAGLSHAAFGGVALGLLLQVEPLWTTLPFTVLVALGINWVRGRTGLAGDTSIGIFFAISVALGIVFLSLKEEYTADAFAYLFGSILAVRAVDLWVAAATAALALLTLPLWGRWAYATFDSELAQADQLQVEQDNYLLSVFLAISVVVAVKMVGIILLAAFLVIPPATARMVSPTFRIMTILSVAMAMLTAGIGLLLSYTLDIPSGAAIILLQAVVFFVTAAVRQVR